MLRAAYSNASLGVFSNYTEASNRVDLRFRQHAVEWFVQDNWRATRRLTLELGLRFHYLVPIYGSTNQLSSFAPELYNKARTPRLIQPAIVGGVRVGVNPATGVTYPQALIGAIAPGTGDAADGMAVSGQNGYPRSLIDTYHLRLGPRAGFAYDVFGNGKTAVRGGFGLFYNRPNMSDNLLLFASQIPVISNPTIYYSTLNSLLSSGGAIFPQAVNGLDRSDKVPYVMNFSFSVQQAIGRSTVVEAGYVGSLGRDLLWRRNINSIPVGTNFLPSSLDPTTPGKAYATSFLRPTIGYTDILMTEAASSSNYNSAHITARRRMTRNLQFGLSWTWSKAMNYNDNDTDTITSLISPRVWNYGLAGFDRTHLFKLNYVYSLPKTPFRSIVLKESLNGWQISGITSFLSGAPLAVGFTSASGLDYTGTATQAARIVVLASPIISKSERDFYNNFKKDVFAPPTVGSFGNAARTVVRGPGVNNWDLSLFKEFPIREQMRFQFRAEAYNAFNHTQFSAEDTTARFDNTGKQTNTLLSSFTAARTARIMQLALRFYF